MVLLGGLEFIAAGYIISEATKHKRARRIQEENEQQQRREHAHRRRRHSDQGPNHTYQAHHQNLPAFPQHRKSSVDKQSRDHRHDRNDYQKPSGKGDFLPLPILKNPRRNESAPPPGGYLPTAYPPQGQWQQLQPPMNGGTPYDDPNRYVPSYHYPPPPPLPMSPPAPHQSYPAYQPIQPPPYTHTLPPPPQSQAMVPSHYVPPPQEVWEMPGAAVMTHAYPAPMNEQARPFSPHVHFADEAQSSYGRQTPPPPYREV